VLELSQLNNKSLFRQKLISSTITIVFLIAVMGIASLFAIWKMEREYNQNLLKVEALKNISEQLSLAQLNLKSADQEWKNIITRARDKETKIKYKSLFEKKISEFQENIEKIESDDKTQILALKDITNLKKDSLIIIDQYRNLLSEYSSLSLTEGILLDKKTMGLTKNIENKLFIINQEINETYFALQVKNDFEIRYHQLRQFLILVILFALFLSFINLFKALRVSSE
jgi:CHASE3 domain sensor protein